jgi:hypothetical protein
MATEKRMIENYEVISSVHIGDKEIVLAIDEIIPMAKNI